MPAKNQNRTRKMRSLEPRFFQFQELGDSIEGELTGKQTFTYRNGNEGNRYILTQDDGELVQFNGTTQLNTLLSLVGDGVYVAITYVSDVETDQPQPAKIFDVQIEDTD